MNKLIKHKRVKLYEAPKMDISSTLIRDLIRKNKSIKGLVPEEIFDKMGKI